GRRESTRRVIVSAACRRSHHRPHVARAVLRATWRGKGTAIATLATRGADTAQAARATSRGAQRAGERTSPRRPAGPTPQRAEPAGARAHPLGDQRRPGRRHRLAAEGRAPTARTLARTGHVRVPRT